MTRKQRSGSLPCPVALFQRQAGSSFTCSIASEVRTDFTFGSSSVLARRPETGRDRASHNAGGSRSPGHGPAFANVFQSGPDRRTSSIQVPIAAPDAPWRSNEVKPKQLSVESRAVAFNIALVIERPQAPQARRRRDSNPTRQFDIRHSSVGLEFTQNHPIDVIKSGAQFVCLLARKKDSPHPYF